MAKKFFAAPLTCPQTAAIASVAVWAENARPVLRSVFAPNLPQPGYFVFGKIIDSKGHLLDSVILGCEHNDAYVIHCHSNPLIVETIIRLLVDLGAELKTSEEYLHSKVNPSLPMLIKEAIETAAKSASIKGAEWVFCQTHSGLTKWLDCLATQTDIDVSLISNEIKNMINRRRRLNYLLKGIRIVLVGPANSGKSTLLNWFAGKNAALVSPLAGTTRDWVAVTCRIHDILAVIIDTAGLDIHLAASDNIQTLAQIHTIQQIASADLILLTIDSSRPHILDIPNLQTPLLKVFTKSDIASPVLTIPSDSALVSALQNSGMGRLCDLILDTLDIKKVDISEPVVFTDRQERIFNNLLQMQNLSDVKEMAAKLTDSIYKSFLLNNL